MIKHHKKPKEQKVLFNNGIIKTPYTGRLFVETIFKPSTEGGSILFATYGLDKMNNIKSNIISYQTEIVEDGNKGKIHYSPSFMNSKLLFQKKVVLLPSGAEEYGSEEELIKEIRDYIHRYIDISPFFEELVSYYVLFTWVFDNFNELPYLRFFGDYGTGKTTALKVVGSICFRPIFIGGAATPSPIFRMIEQFNGTLIIDEGDFKTSETWSDIVKIFNCGHTKGFPVLRTEKTGEKQTVRAFDVFGPKILAAREGFQDNALESRFLTERMQSDNIRPDILFNLPDCFWDEATVLRNKLLMWRFKNYGKKQIDTSLENRNIEPRLNQIMLPLASIVTDKKVQKNLMEFIEKRNKEIILERGSEFDAEILESYIKLGVLQTSGGKIIIKEITIGEITDAINKTYGEKYDKKLNPRKIGYIINKKLGLKTQRLSNGIAVTTDNKVKIILLAKKFGLEIPNNILEENKDNKEEVKEKENEQLKMIVKG